MSPTTTTSPSTTARPSVEAPPRTGGRHGIPWRILVTIELRKLVDTRAARWLLGLTVIAGIAVGGLAVGLTDPTRRALEEAWSGALAPAGLLLPVMAILAVTGEHTQRTILTTFALEPRRGRVLRAKAAAVALATLALLLATAVTTALAALAGWGAGAPVWSVSAFGVLGPVLDLALGVAGGFALALLLRHTAGAVCLFLAWGIVLPSALLALGVWWHPMTQIMPWIDPTTARSVLSDAAAPGAVAWARIGVVTALWTLVPGSVGWGLIRRQDVG